MLGDRLRSGLVSELNDFDNCIYVKLTEALVYLYLRFLITWDTFHSLTECLKMEDKVKPSGTDREEMAGKFAEILFRDISRKMDCICFDDMIGQLNRYRIPSWIRMYISDIKALIPNCRMVGDSLYYLIGNRLDDSMRFYRFSENPDEQEKLFPRDGVLLGSGFSEIVEVNEAGKLYLAHVSQGSYSVFDCGTETFYVERGTIECVLSSGAPVVSSREGFLEIRRSGIDRIIKPSLNYESYEAQGNLIKVTPDYDERWFFAPYYVNGKGKIIPISDIEKKALLWEYLAAAIGINAVKTDICSGVFSADYLVTALDDLCTSVSCYKPEQLVAMVDVLTLLKEQVGGDYDLTDILYMLADLDRKLIGPICCFPSSVLMDRLRILSRRLGERFGVLFMTMDSPNTLATIRNLILGESYDDFFDNNDGKTYTDEAQIGTYKVLNGSVTAMCMNIEDGVCVGNRNIPSIKGEEMDGMVVYDCIENIFYVIGRALTEKSVKQEIVELFRLKCSNKMFITEGD